MKKAVIYARYSSERQTEQSIEGQLRVCNDYAQRNDIVVVDTYIDRAMTGTNDNRASFQKMLKDSSKKVWDYVIVYKIDRFSRNKYETAMHKKTLRDNGVKLLSAMENIPDTPEGIILESLLEGMAEYYSAELSQKVRRGMNESRRKGLFTGGRVLYGYSVIDKKVIINEDEAQVVRNLFLDFASGRLVTDVLQELKETGVLYRGKNFGRNTLYNFLRNRKFTGEYVYKGEVFTNIYPQIISKELFETVRNKIETNKLGKHKPDIVYLLKFKLKCGYCGNPVSSDAGTSKTGAIKRYYKCYGRRKKICHHSKPIRKELIEDLVLNAILSTLETNELILHIAQKVIDINKKRIENNSVLNLLIKEQEKVEQSITNVLSAIDKGIITNSTKQHLEDLENNLDKIKEQIIIEKTKERMQITEEDVFKYLKQAITKKPKQMIDMIVKQVILYNDKIEIFFKYNKFAEDEIQNQSIFKITKEVKMVYNEEPSKIDIDILV
ncbi:MAG: recombinase family protein [Clostridia bacterium]|nr:recombinase family protein [Clostridia bacterium]